MVLATTTKRTEELWPTVTMAYFAIMRFLTLEYNVSAVGKQWTAATLTAVILSVVAGPATYVVVIVWNGGVEAVWISLGTAYGSMAVILAGMFVLFDWKSYSEKVLEWETGAIRKHQNGRMEARVNAETTPILTV